MIKTITSFFLLSLSFLCCNVEEEIIKVIKSKKYSFSVESNMRFLNNTSKREAVLRPKSSGEIHRNMELFNLKTNNLIAIQEDSLFFMIDPFLLTATLIKKESLGASILPFSLDPWDIFYFLEKSAKKKKEENLPNAFIIHYLPNDTNALKSVSVTFSKNRDLRNNFKVTLVYQQRNNLVSEIIEYKKNDTIPKNMPLKFADYLVKNENKYQLTKKYKDYSFTNFIEFFK